MHEPSAARRSLARLDALDAALINRLQGELPLVARPFAAVAEELGCSEDELLERLHRLLGEGTLTRFGGLETLYLGQMVGLVVLGAGMEWANRTGQRAGRIPPIATA